MRTGVTVQLNPTDRKRLPAIIDGRNSPQKHVWRAMIVVGTADGLGTAAIMRTAGVSKTAVWRWQEFENQWFVDRRLRCEVEGVEVLTCENRAVRMQRSTFRGSRSMRSSSQPLHLAICNLGLLAQRALGLLVVALFASTRSCGAE